MTEKISMPIHCLKGIKASTFSPAPERAVRTQEDPSATKHPRTEAPAEPFHPMIFDGATGLWKTSTEERLQPFFAESKKT